MTSYRITSKSGEVYGIYEGETEAHALVAMHRDAGLGEDRAWIDEDDVVFDSDETRAMAGGVDAWNIEEVADVLCPRCGKANSLAHEDGATDGPRAYHATCWYAMSDDEQAKAWSEAGGES